MGHWIWPWVGLGALVLAAGIVIGIVTFLGTRDTQSSPETVFSLDDDLAGEQTSKLFRQWRVLGRIASVALIVAGLVGIILIARPAAVDQSEEQSSSRDIVLCLDVSGSTLPYDLEVINTYAQLVKNFKGERIALSIFNSTSRTVFPLTDDYDLVTEQLNKASEALAGVQNQDSIDKMTDEQYQNIANWLEGTQNRKDATSLIGDGVVSCAAMLPGFAYGKATATSDASRQRAASIVLATDNVVSGKPTYTLNQALALTSQTKITVDGLYSGPKSSEGDQTTADMKSAIEAHGGTFLTQSDGTSVNQLVREIQQRRSEENDNKQQASLSDAPAWWLLALAVALIAWIALAWRLRR